MVRPPVTLPPDQLPLNDHNFSWKRFQTFCCDFISQLPGVKKYQSHVYGKDGDAQKGIDIFADLENGERWVFQCKQYEKYYPCYVKEAIDKATYQANRYILLLSCEATTSVRNEVDKHKHLNWYLWDVVDTSRIVRYELPQDVARRLIQYHFGAAWRKEFLGLAGLITFVSSADFFHPILNPENLFNHHWKPVGEKRAEFIKELHEFVESEQQRIAILTGRGGIGKTKLLHAFSEEFDNRHQKFVLRFLMEGVRITSESLDELPTQPCVVVIDDAHRCDDLSVLLAFAQQHPQRIKLILSSRPQGVDYLRSILTQAGFDSREVRAFDSLKGLSRYEVKELARQALGNTYALYADRLAAITRDCPLVTVVGGQLLAQNQVEPQLLERDEDFQNSVLTKFQDVLIGQVSDHIDPQLCRQLLKLIAATAPIQPDTEQFKQLAAEFLDTRQSVLDDAIEILEESGVLLRRGDIVRITPDVLADHILHEACLKRGRTRGYAQQLFEKFFPVYPAQILRNLAELDWRISNVSGEETDLLTDIWQSIKEKFEKASNFDRCKLLDLLTEVAYYQPKETIELVEFVMRNPATTPEDETLARIHRYTHTDVLAKLPSLLKRVGYTLDYLSQCCDLLWKLGRDDERNLNSHPVHAIRVLTELAEYAFDKPLEFNRIVLKAVSRWLGQPDAHNHIHSPLDVLDPLLDKSVQSMRVSSRAISLCPFGVSREKTLSIRQQVLQLITDCTTSDELDIVLRAVKSLKNAKVFDIEFGVSPDALTDNELKTLLSKLEPVRSLEDCSISEFLAYGSKRQPRSVVQMFLNRIERGREAPDDYHPFVSSYEPLPSGGFHYELNGLADSEEYEDILRGIRDQTLEWEWKTISWFSTLYDVVSLGFIPASLKVLNEWIDSGDAEKIKAASRLVPSGFVFTHVEFVTNLLEQAYAAGDECYRIVSSYFRCGVTSGLRIGISGEPFPQDIALQEQASAIAARFIKGSHLYRFYHSIAEYAKANVQEQLALEEELD
jgi:hypothetical protein